MSLGVLCQSNLYAANNRFLSFENPSDIFLFNVSDSGRDSSNHFGDGNCSLKMKDLSCAHSSYAQTYIKNGPGEIQFVIGNFPNATMYELIFSIEGEKNETITFLPYENWVASERYRLPAIPAGEKRKLIWTFKYRKHCDESDGSKYLSSCIWIDNIELTGLSEFAHGSCPMLISKDSSRDEIALKLGLKNSF